MDGDEGPISLPNGPFYVLGLVILALMLTAVTTIKCGTMESEIFSVQIFFGALLKEKSKVAMF